MASIRQVCQKVTNERLSELKVFLKQNQLALKMVSLKILLWLIIIPMIAIDIFPVFVWILDQGEW